MDPGNNSCACCLILSSVSDQQNNEGGGHWPSQAEGKLRFKEEKSFIAASSGISTMTNLSRFLFLFCAYQAFLPQEALLGVNV